MFKMLMIFKLFETFKMFNKPVSQDLQHLFPSALTPVAWPQPVQRRISILVIHFNFHLRKKSVNCPNIFYISFYLLHQFPVFGALVVTVHLSV